MPANFLWSPNRVMEPSSFLFQKVTSLWHPILPALTIKNCEVSEIFLLLVS